MRIVAFFWVLSTAGMLQCEDRSQFVFMQVSENGTEASLRVFGTMTADEFGRLKLGLSRDPGQAGRGGVESFPLLNGLLSEHPQAIDQEFVTRFQNECSEALSYFGVNSAMLLPVRHLAAIFRRNVLDQQSMLAVVKLQRSQVLSPGWQPNEGDLIDLYIGYLSGLIYPGTRGDQIGPEISYAIYISDDSQPRRHSVVAMFSEAERVSLVQELEQLTEYPDYKQLDMLWDLTDGSVGFTDVRLASSECRNALLQVKSRLGRSLIRKLLAACRKAELTEGRISVGLANYERIGDVIVVPAQ